MSRAARRILFALAWLCGALAVGGVAASTLIDTGAGPSGPPGLVLVGSEMILSASDFLVRRTGSLFFNIQRVIDGMEPVLAVMKERLGWDQTKIETERKRLLDSVKLSTQFK